MKVEQQIFLQPLLATDIFRTQQIQTDYVSSSFCTNYAKKHHIIKT